MNSISRRHKLIGGVFGIVAVVWGLDMLTGGLGPSPAGAADTSAIELEPIALPSNPGDLDAVVESLRDDGIAHVALPFDQVARDLFAPTARMEAVLYPPAPELSADAEARNQPEAEQLPFEARHQLQGILTGQVPLALIDGRLYRRGAEIDGYRLVELRSDYVVLRQDETRVTLRVVPGQDQ